MAGLRDVLKAFWMGGRTENRLAVVLVALLELLLV